MNQYYIDAPNGAPDDNLDLFVTAASPAGAVSLWIAYYEIERGMLPEDARIALVPVVSTSAEAHQWDDIESWNVTADGTVAPFTPRP
jgi:hypothetical protein